MTLKKWIHRIKVRFRWIERSKCRVSYAPQSSQEEHTCMHCGTQFVGNYCPQCGKQAQWERFTFKRLILNFLDIWGLGNRPMLRTIRDLFWRPGYMIRDYLNGHYLSYFPPFKMLAVLTIFIIFFAWCFGIDYRSSIQNAVDMEKDLSPAMVSLFNYVKAAYDFINEHLLYSILLQNVLLVLVTWFLFRKKSKMNLVETFFSQIYINCQFNIITLVLMLLFRFFYNGSVLPYMVPDLLAILVLLYDYRQLYGLKTWPTLWRILLLGVLMVTLYISLAILVLLIVAVINMSF